MTEIVFRFRARKQVPPPGLGSDEHTQTAAAVDNAPWTDHDVPCWREDSIFDAMRSVSELRDDDTWAWILAGEGSPAILLKPAQAISEAILLGGDTKIADLADYFGPWLDDSHVRFELEPLEGVGNGAGPGGVPWEILYTTYENIGFALEFYGAVEAGRRAIQYVQGRRASPARHEVQVWTQFGTISRRLRRYLGRRDEWHTSRLQRLLKLEPLQLGKLLRQCGFETTPERPDYWTKAPKDLP